MHHPAGPDEHGAQPGATDAPHEIDVLEVGRVVRRIEAADGYERDVGRGHGTQTRIVVHIVEDEEPDAYALPGLGGRVVVSTAMSRSRRAWWVPPRRTSAYASATEDAECFIASSRS